MSVPVLLRLSAASDDESRAIDQMLYRLADFASVNLKHESHYDGTFVTDQYGFSIPPSMRGIGSVVGWGGTVVDVLEERLDWLGWRVDGDTFGLDQVYADNHLDVESGMAHLDSLIYGTSFVTVGLGDEREPSPLVTVQSPLTTTAVWDRRTRRVLRALSVVREDGVLSEVTLYTPEERTRFEFDGNGFRPIDRYRHGLGRVPVVQMPNRVRASDVTGRSEITAPVRYYSEAAVRTLMGIEVHREFYQAPQRWAMNVDPSKFVDSDGHRQSPWASVMGRVWAIPPNEDGEDSPSVGQFQPASPSPYIDQVRNLATLLAAEAGFPASYLGFQTDNPSSADAIRAGEARLVKRAERRQTVFGKAWMEVGRLALLMRDGAVPESFPEVSLGWRDAATPTRAASADAAAKLVASGILPADSSVTYDRIGLSPAEQRQLREDRRRSAGRSVLGRLTAPTTEPQRQDDADLA